MEQLWSREQEVKTINSIQDKYINELIEFCTTHPEREEINFNSPTGTGKTKMISKLINSTWGQQRFFIVTSLSRGGLNKQIKESLDKDCKFNNFLVHGVSEMTANTHFQMSDLYDEIKSLNAGNKPIVWIRDEAHINTNVWSRALLGKPEYIINFSATNEFCDIQCDFDSTSILRTVAINTGSPAQALDKLLEVKKEHANIKNYNPCAIFRCINNETLHDDIVNQSESRGLKWIDLNEQDYDIRNLCKDDNSYDVIINKMKIVEGIDLRRAHVIYLGNVPDNNATIIQLIGRIRRNALLWRDDIDIFNPSNANLLSLTRQCYAYYNAEENKKEDCAERFKSIYRDYRPVRDFKEGTSLIVKNGYLVSNGYFVPELKGETGSFEVKTDTTYGFKYAHPIGEYYKKSIVQVGGKPQHGYEVVQTELWGNKTIGYYDTDANQYIPLSECIPYKKIYNEFETALLGWDLSKFIKDGMIWIEDRAVTSKITKSRSNLYQLINTKYAEELKKALQEIQDNHLTSGQNNFDFNRLCNTCLGWLVEFYTKYLIFGRDFLFSEIKKAQSEAHTDTESEQIIFYACFLKYKEMMQNAFGPIIAKLIKGPTIEDYVKEEYQKFVSTVIELAQKTKDFLINQKHLVFQKDGLYYSDNLSIKHITARADFITEDTIVDLKTTSHIEKNYVYQVLAYHYLSTKRSDLNIKRVIVFDCVTGKSIEIPISQQNLTTFFAQEKINTKKLPQIIKTELSSIINKSFIQSNKNKFQCIVDRESCQNFIYLFREQNPNLVGKELDFYNACKNYPYVLSTTMIRQYAGKQANYIGTSVDFNPETWDWENYNHLFDYYSRTTMLTKIKSWINLGYVIELHYGYKNKSIPTQYKQLRLEDNNGKIVQLTFKERKEEESWTLNSFVFDN